MNIRELTPRQRYNLVRRMGKDYKEFLRAHHLTKDVETSFRIGFDRGVKATLEKINVLPS